MKRAAIYSAAIYAAAVIAAFLLGIQMGIELTRAQPDPCQGLVPTCFRSDNTLEEDRMCNYFAEREYRSGN